MFNSLQEKLESAFKNLKGQARITELNIAATIKEIRRALVDADVNYKIAKDFTDKVKDKAIGEKVQHFKVGDEVYYAGSNQRQGSYAEYQLVDERIVGLKPRTLTDAEAAALPLTSLTAYEMLFHRLKVQETKREKPLILLKTI